MSCDDLEGWDKEEGREEMEGGSRWRGYGDMCMHMADSFCCVTLTQYCEEIILQ